MPKKAAKTKKPAGKKAGVKNLGAKDAGSVKGGVLRLRRLDEK